MVTFLFQQMLKRTLLLSTANYTTGHSAWQASSVGFVFQNVAALVFLSSVISITCFVCRLSPSQSPRTSNLSPVTNTLTQLAVPSHTQDFFFLVACPHTHQAACVRAALEAVATGAPLT